MNSPQTHFQQSPNTSGAIRYERVAILEAALNIKEQQQRQWWTRAATIAGIMAITAAGVVLATM